MGLLFLAPDWKTPLRQFIAFEGRVNVKICDKFTLVVFYEAQLIDSAKVTEISTDDCYFRGALNLLLSHDNANPLWDEYCQTLIKLFSSLTEKDKKYRGYLDLEDAGIKALNRYLAEKNCLKQDFLQWFFLEIVEIDSSAQDDK